MREIEFRGKRIECDNWVYGFYSPLIWYPSLNQTPSIKTFNGGDIEINLETLGQYTGLKDKNGTKIFEGDILQDNDYGICKPNRGVITYEGTGFCAMKDNGCYLLDVYELEGSACMYEVIGNIYDNPELLGETT